MEAPAISQETASNISFNENLFTEVFWKIRRAKTRFIINFGGAASSKSYSQMQLSIINMMVMTDDGLVIRKYASDLENSVYDGIRKIISDWNISDRFKFVYSNQKREITCLQTGARILFKGLDDPDKIKSIVGIKWIYIEEANQLEEEDFRELNRRARGMEGVQITLVFNPIIINHWIKRYFFDQPIVSIKTTFIHSTYLDNIMNLTEDDISELLNLKHINPNDYKIYTLGEWGSIRTGQEFYSAFKFTEHVRSVEYLDGYPLHISFDQNVVPYITMTIYQLQQVENIYYVNQIDELCLRNPDNKTESLCEAFIAKYGHVLEHGLYYYGDATGRNRDTRGKENDYDIVERMLGKWLNDYSNRVPRSNPGIKKRRDFINKLLAKQFNIRFGISKRCKTSISDFEMIQEDPEGKKHKKKKTDRISGIQFEEYGHTSDSFDYFITSAFRSYI